MQILSKVIRKIGLAELSGDVLVVVLCSVHSSSPGYLVSELSKVDYVWLKDQNSNLESKNQKNIGNCISKQCKELP